MISKNEIKYIKSLYLKKFRDIEKIFVAEGKNSVTEGLSSKFVCRLVAATNSFAEENPEILNLAEEKKIRYEVTGDIEFKRISDSLHPQGVLALFELPEEKHLGFEDSADTYIYLDDISDPGNTGTILRTCDWFDFTKVILSPHSADVYNPKTIRSSAGSLFHLEIYTNRNISDFINEINSSGYKIISSDLEGENVNSFKFPQKSILVFSNEANGLSGSVRGITHKKITIPLFGRAESLNVASAAAIILSAARNQYK